MIGSPRPLEKQQEKACPWSVAQERSSLRHRHALERGLPGLPALPGGLYGGEVIKLFRCLC